MIRRLRRLCPSEEFDFSLPAPVLEPPIFEGGGSGVKVAVAFCELIGFVPRDSSGSVLAPEDFKDVVVTCASSSKSSGAKTAVIGPRRSESSPDRDNSDVLRCAFWVKGLDCPGGRGRGSVARDAGGVGKSSGGPDGALFAPAGAGKGSVAAPTSQLISVGVSGARARLCGSIASSLDAASPLPESCATTTVMLSSPPRLLARSIICWQADLKSVDS